MELTELKNRITDSFNGSKDELKIILSYIDEDKEGIYPFNEFELLITTCIAQGKMTYDKYMEIRHEYFINNPYLWVFEISAPRGFGESFAQTFLQAKSSKLQVPSKRIDPNYHGQYDLCLKNIHIEVKASRVTDSECENAVPLYKKALSSATKRPFLMNFQQLKPQCCDVFIWMAVYRDAITIWVLNSQEVMQHPDYSKGQHRGNNGNEGQLHITEKNIKTLNHYKLRTGGNIVSAIRKAYARMK